MGHTAAETFSTFGVGILCISLGIMALAAFFKLLSCLGSFGRSAEPISVRGVLTKSTWATVHMSSGAGTFQRVRIMGFTNRESMKTNLPYDLHGMVILEDQNAKRFLVRAKAIRMIVIEPETGEPKGKP
jgi:hypothetical protein